MNKNRVKGTNEKINKSLDEHKNSNGYIDVNNMIYEMHGVLSSNPYTQISKSHKYL